MVESHAFLILFLYVNFLVPLFQPPLAATFPITQKLGRYCMGGAGGGGWKSEAGKSRPNTLRPSYNPFSRPVAYPVYTNKKSIIEIGILFLGRAGNNRCIGLDYVLTVPMKNTHLLNRC